METAKVFQKTFTIPLDMLMDILKIVIDNSLTHHFSAINERECTLRLNVKIPTDHPFAKEIIQDIGMKLAEFDHYLHGHCQDEEFWNNLSHQAKSWTV